MRGRTITFVSPVSLSTETPRSSKWGFLLMQGAGQTLSLEYDTYSEAIAARQDILKLPSTYKVPSKTLFQAITKALTAASKEGTPTPIKDPDTEDTGEQGDKSKDDHRNRPPVTELP